MRKRIIETAPPQDLPAGKSWLDLEAVAEVEITSEAPEYPIENALLPHGDGSGWRAAHPGEQTIRLVFDTPQRIRRIGLEFGDASTERTQEFALRWSADGGRSFTEIVRQQWNFSRTGATSETEDYQVDLQDVSVLELVIVPDISGGEARASLTRLRLA